jgi:hypothetical protein
MNLGPAVSLHRRQGKTTPSFTSQQGYFSPANIGGMGVNDTRNYPGAFGDDIRVFDIEYSWNRDHEDLAGAKFLPVTGSTNLTVVGDTDHGTSVAGIVVGARNNFGVEGIAPNATFRCAGPPGLFANQDLSPLAARKG